MTVARLPLIAAHPRWRAAQILGVLATVALLVAFVIRPTSSLHLLWDMVIPLLPAVFVLNPLIWRNVCPLATLNEVGARYGAGRLLAPPTLQATWTVGVVLLVLMVPARRFLFNTNGLAMTLTVTVVALLAVGGGLAASRRAGFCNSLCPVLPVEKLYGQAPVMEVGSARCADCNHCVSTGCIDLAGRKGAAQSVGGGRHGHWMWSPFGIFAAAFPGFIVGYFRTVDGPFETAGAVYGTVGLWTAGSAVVAALLVSRLRPARALLLLGTAAITAYYWFAAPRLAEAYGGGVAAGGVLRMLALAGIAAWATRGWRRLSA